MYKRVFISHSRHDPNLDFFHKIFSASPAEAIWMEFEDLKAPPYFSIKDNVNKSDAVFVLLSEPLVGKQHTSNWVSFEVGLAANRHTSDADGEAKEGQEGLDVFVFEPLDRKIDFAVPYFTHYMRYPVNDSALKWLRNSIRDGSLFKAGVSISCKWDDCKIPFNYLSRFYTDSFFCPSCRRENTFQKSYKDFDSEGFQKEVAEAVIEDMRKKEESN